MSERRNATWTFRAEAPDRRAEARDFGAKAQDLKVEARDSASIPDVDTSHTYKSAQC